MSVSPTEEFSDWVKIPTTLQNQFFELARKEAEKTRKRLLEENQKLSKLTKHLIPRQVTKNNEWKDWRVTCVDGSDSPVLSERLGARYGTFAAGYMLFEGDKLIGEDYSSGYLSMDQVGDPLYTEKILDLMRWKLERDKAVECLKELSADLVLIDGPFFGYRAESSRVRELPLDIEGFKVGSELVDYVTQKSIELLDSKKVVGIVKRVRTAAIDGWIAYTNGDESQCLNRNDRDILSVLMSPEQWFSYEWLLKEPDAYNYFNWYRQTKKDLEGKDRSEILKQAKRRFEVQVRTDLAQYAVDKVLKTARRYVRTSQDAPPVCYEINNQMDDNPILGYIMGFHNPGTGLPFPIDLTDQNVTMPRGFTKEFVQEIEAILLRDSTADRMRLYNHFANLNPQKEEG